MKFPIREVALIGAGPVGLDLAHHLQQRKIAYYHFEKGPIGQSLLDLPPDEIIGAADQITVGAVPLPKRSPVNRNTYLAYLRRVVEQRQLAVNTFENVAAIQRMGDLWHLRTTGYDDVCHQYRARRIVFATGNCGVRPNDSFPGSDSPLLHRKMRDPHYYFQRRVLILGDGPAAQSAALRCAAVARRVYLCCDRTELATTPGRPELREQLIELIQSGRVEFLANRQVTGLSGHTVTLENAESNPETLAVDFLISRPEYRPDYSLFQRLGVALKGTQMAPVHDPETMETNVPGIYIAGAIALGNGSAQRAIAQGSKHNQRISADLAAKLGIQQPAKTARRDTRTAARSAARSWWPPQLPSDAPTLGVGS